MTRLSGKSNFGIYLPHLRLPRLPTGAVKRSFFFQDRFGVDRDLDHVADDYATFI